jgi:hypothetical protein
VVRVAHRPTFTITELLGNGDSVPWKRLLKKLGFTDMTPLYGHKPGVQSFDRLGSAAWVKYQAAFARDSKALAADWHYFSGHHGSRVALPAVTSAAMQFDHHAETAFFNEAYHSGTWSGNPVNSDEVLMTSSSRPSTLPLRASENPFLAPLITTKGVINIACNTFTYRASRMWLRDTFPNAVIFGMMNTTPGGLKAIAPFIGARLHESAIKGAFSDNPAFWLNPRSYFAPKGRVDSALVEATVRDLNMAYLAATRGGLRKGDIGIMIDNKLYWWDYDKGTPESIRAGKVRVRNYDAHLYSSP